MDVTHLYIVAFSVKPNGNIIDHLIGDESVKKQIKQNIIKNHYSTFDTIPKRRKI